jgi:hypothetical protein
LSALWRFLTSLRTCAWTGLAFTAAGVVGSLFLGRRPDLFGDMDRGLLGEWFRAKGFADPAATLWLYALLAATGLMALNAACCTVERLSKILKGKATLRRLLPHVMHLAFLGVVAAHLASSVSGERHGGIVVPQGGTVAVPGTPFLVRLDRFDLEVDPVLGYPRSYGAWVTLGRDGRPVASGKVEANGPLLHDGYALYLKDFGPSPFGAPQGEFALNRDPGAPFILLFSVLFTAANLLYLLPPRKGERWDDADDPANARSRRRSDAAEDGEGAVGADRPDGEEGIAARLDPPPDKVAS